jgi:anti-sigma factor RsiW
MNISRNVIQDLIPLYLADEACPDTRALVEEFIAADAELAAEVARMKSTSPNQILTGGNIMSLPQDHETQTLARTRSEISHRSWNLGLAIAFTTFPCSFIVAHGQIQWMLIRDSPSLAMASWAAAIGFWVGYAIHNRRLRSSGL